MTHTLADIHALTNDQLRKAIAEVLGWKFCKAFPQSPRSYPIPPGNTELIPITDGNYGEIIWDKTEPNWPVNIADAWELVEDILDNDFSFSLLDLSSVPDRYMMDIRQRGCARVLHYTQAPTAPRAICEAWLMWRMEGKPTP